MKNPKDFFLIHVRRPTEDWFCSVIGSNLDDVGHMAADLAVWCDGGFSLPQIGRREIDAIIFDRKLSDAIATERRNPK